MTSVSLLCSVQNNNKRKHGKNLVFVFRSPRKKCNATIELERKTAILRLKHTHIKNITSFWSPPSVNSIR